MVDQSKRNTMQLTKIKMQPLYGRRVAVIPVPDDPGAWKQATREQLSVLLVVMAESELSYLSIAEKTGATVEQINDALRYWSRAGVLTLEECERPVRLSASATQASQAGVSVPERPERAAVLPHYNTEETARFLERNPATAGLVDCCQQELGKMFTTAETEIIIGLLDYLSLDAEYILLLCAHCAKNKKKSLRYIEKMAISLHDAGITTYDQLEIHLKKIDAVGSAESELREMFGIGKRALIKREKECFSRWVAEWELPLDMIRHAYEITVSRTGDAAVAYANAILEKWYAAGYRTLDDVLAAEEEKRPASSPASGSFDTDDFFEAAIIRSYGQ